MVYILTQSYQLRMLIVESIGNALYEMRMLQYLKEIDMEEIANSFHDLSDNEVDQEITLWE